MEVKKTWDTYEGDLLIMPNNLFVVQKQVWHSSCSFLNPPFPQAMLTNIYSLILVCKMVNSQHCLRGRGLAVIWHRNVLSVPSLMSRIVCEIYLCSMLIFWLIIPYCYLFSQKLNFAKKLNGHISRDLNFAI